MLNYAEKLRVEKFRVVSLPTQPYTKAKQIIEVTNSWEVRATPMCLLAHPSIASAKQARS